MKRFNIKTQIDSKFKKKLKKKIYRFKIKRYEEYRSDQLHVKYILFFRMF